MTEQAALVRYPGAPFELVPFTPTPLGGDDIRVRIAAVGMCHTDLAVRDGKIPGVPMPSILGHEGAGVVEAVGSDVTDIACGDHVVLSFASCGVCFHCQQSRPADCDRFFALNFLSPRQGVSCGDPCETTAHGDFFNQSSFATLSTVKARNAVRVPRDLPLEILAPLGCGVITGAGTVLNYMKAAPNSSLAVFGAGAVGLSAIMAAKIARCDPIIAVDLQRSRLDLARELGATHTIDAGGGDERAQLRALLPEGADFVLDTSGAPGAIVAALGSVARRGAVVLVAGTPGEPITLDMSLLLTGASIRMVAEGASAPREFIPAMIEHYRAGRFPIDRLVKVYDFESINEAARDAESGVTVKPVLRMPSSRTKALAE